MSHILFHIIKKKLPNWNSRIYSYADIPVLCRETRVGFVEGPTKYKGEYRFHDGYPIIVVRNGIRDRLRDWIAFHELGHHLLHYPSTHKFSKSIFTKADREANFFAAIALMPTLLCRAMTPGEIAVEYGYPTELIEIRVEISTHFQL